MSGPRVVQAEIKRSTKSGALRVLSTLPFAPRRLFWLDAPRGAVRGGHAHRSNQQLVVPVCGALTARCTWWRGGRKRVRVFDLPSGRGLYLPALVWLELHWRTAGVCAVLASEPYAAQSYINRLEDLRGLSC